MTADRLPILQKNIRSKSFSKYISIPEKKLCGNSIKTWIWWSLASVQPLYVQPGNVPNPIPVSKDNQNNISNQLAKNSRLRFVRSLYFCIYSQILNGWSSRESLENVEVFSLWQCKVSSQKRVIFIENPNSFTCELFNLGWLSSKKLQAERTP